MFKFKSFPEYRQLDHTDCGPACLKIVAAHFGNYIKLNYLRNLCNKTAHGTSFNDLVKAGNQIGLELTGVRASIEQLKTDVDFPIILHINQNHFVVVYDIDKHKVRISDPEHGLVQYPINEFSEKFSDDLILLLVQAKTKSFIPENEIQFSNLGFFVSRLSPYRSFYSRLILALLILVIVQTALPFLTQSLVDYGIGQGDLRFINLILFAQIFLILTILLSKVIREQILLRVSMGFAKNLLNDFVERILYLPIKFIESKNIGDFIQRIKDHDRIQVFLNQTAFSLVFDLLSILVFTVILAIFDLTIFLIFIFAFVMLLVWSSLFLRKQAFLDRESFKLNAEEQSQVVQLVNNASEVKLNGSYLRRKLEWRKVQVAGFQKELQVLSTEQWQYLGGLFIKDITGITIVFVSAKAVVDGSMTFGTILAIQFIVGSLSLPVSNLLDFINELQKTALSLERILDLLTEKVSDNTNREYIQEFSASGLELRDLSFSYGNNSKQILSNINLTIPKHKITAFVGHSGSGKSTLLKVLLKLYQPTSGSICLDNQNLKNISPDTWQKRCAAVLQNGRLFDDTIERNITESNSDVSTDFDLLNQVIKLAMLEDFVESLPMGLQTKVGENANFISGGEKQRIMIARALYKQPDYLFLDEATSSLDAQNERLITKNILKFSSECTIVVAAHRLSTVKSADQILVMDKGEVIETGSHEDLIARKGAYYELINNQL